MESRLGVNTPLSFFGIILQIQGNAQIVFVAMVIVLELALLVHITQDPVTTPPMIILVFVPVLKIKTYKTNFPKSNVKLS